MSIMYHSKNPANQALRALVNFSFPIREMMFRNICALSGIRRYNYSAISLALIPTPSSKVDSIRVLSSINMSATHILADLLVAIVLFICLRGGLLAFSRQILP
jgi:hypothetical protein